MIRDVYPGSGFFPLRIRAPGIRIRNTEYLKVVRFLSCKFIFSYQRIRQRIGMSLYEAFSLMYSAFVCSVYPVNLLLYLVRIPSLTHLHTSIIYILHLSLSFSLSLCLEVEWRSPPPHAPPRTPAHQRVRHQSARHIGPRAAAGCATAHLVRSSHHLPCIVIF